MLHSTKTQATDRAHLKLTGSPPSDLHEQAAMSVLAKNDGHSRRDRLVEK